jgi:hypothetical protein
MKKVKFPRKHKYGFRLAGDAINWVWFWKIRIPKKIFRPICWIKGHDYHIYWPFGIKIKSCDRCANIKYKKKTTERFPTGSIYKGEIGTLYRVRFFKTSKL